MRAPCLLVLDTQSVPMLSYLRHTWVPRPPSATVRSPALATIAYCALKQVAAMLSPERTQTRSARSWHAEA